MNYEHVLCLEWFFIPRARFPAAHKGLFIAMYMIRINMTHQFVLREKLKSAASPVTISLEKATIIFCVGRVGEDRFAARAAAVVVARS